MADLSTIEATVDQLAFTWKDQEAQHAKTGRPGITYVSERAPILKVVHNETGRSFVIPTDAPVDVLLYRNRKGHIVGILYHYPEDIGEPGDGAWEAAGNVNLMVRPDRQHRGIGRALVEEANRRWDIDWSRQHYTKGGLGLIRAVLGE